MRVVIIEDEAELSSYLSKSISQKGHQTICCQKWSDAEALMAQSDFGCDMLIMDRMLLDKNLGIDDVKRLRNRFPQAGLLVVSAQGGAYERSHYLDSGADDYIAKPFSVEELLSRLHAVHRRIQHQAHSQLAMKLGNLDFRLDQQLVFINLQKVDLSRKEYLVLKLLSDSPSRVYSKYQLLDRVWDIHTDVESNVVEVTIKNLRKKLEAARANVKILSRRNVGYWVEI